MPTSQAHGLALSCVAKGGKNPRSRCITFCMNIHSRLRGHYVVIGQISPTSHPQETSIGGDSYCDFAWFEPEDTRTGCKRNFINRYVHDLTCSDLRKHTVVQPETAPVQPSATT